MGEDVFSLSYDELSIGQEASMDVLMDEKTIDTYSEMIGDTYSFHVSDEAAARTRFGRRIAHGIHLLAYVSFLIGTELPGFGTVYCGQELTFHRPVYLGETAQIRVRVLEKLSSKRIRLETMIFCEGETVLSGEAIVMTWR